LPYFLPQPGLHCNASCFPLLFPRDEGVKSACPLFLALTHDITIVSLPLASRSRGKGEITLCSTSFFFFSLCGAFADRSVKAKNFFFFFLTRKMTGAYVPSRNSARSHLLSLLSQLESPFPFRKRRFGPRINFFPPLSFLAHQVELLVEPALPSSRLLTEESRQ